MQTIPLTKGHVALVDDEDFESLSRHKWTYLSSGYAYRQERRGGRKVTILMHRQLTGAPDGSVVDHRNGDGLDNRRANLRVCTQAQNSANYPRQRRGSSAYKGVHLHNGSGLWAARLVHHGKVIHLGYFRDEAEAARAYDAKALELRGEFAHLNFPDAINEGEGSVKGSASISQAASV